MNLYLEENSNGDEELPTKKLDSMKAKSTNPLDPSDKQGRASNVFGIQIKFPPTAIEKSQIDRVNCVDGLFKCGYAIPLLQSGETCDCGYPYCPEVNMADCESTKMIIHHSKATKDSRNSSLVVLYRTTRKCDHKKFYTGADDQLLRVSAVVQSSSKMWLNRPLHFITYDFLFEYHSSLVAGGNTQNSFVQSKNDVNLVYRGQDIEIPRRTFGKGYEIFIHSLDYDAKKAWGCDLCPKQLDSNMGKSEEEFTDIECHISDGINMGTIENDIKGYTGKDIFDEEIDSKYLVKGIDAKQRTFLNQIKHRKLLQDLSKTQMKASDIKDTISKINKTKKSPNLDLVLNLLQMLDERKKGVPFAYQLLTSELGKCTPVSIILPSHDKLDYKILAAFLEEKCNIFNEYDALEKVTNAFPIIIKIIKMILDYEQKIFFTSTGC